jgi:glycosyltransferase involved in cell wall biosynthesis
MVLLSLQHLWCPYDCVQIHTLPDFMVYVAWLPKLLGSPVILYVQEPTPELWITKFGAARLRWLCRLQAWIQIHAIRFADYSFTVTECLRRALGDRGADTARIDVLHNVSDERFEKFVSPPKAREGEFRLITHGSIEERYGHETVLRAMRLLRDRLPGLRYYIPGDGEFLSKLATLVRQLGLEDRVQMPGYLSFNDPRLHQMLHDSDVCVVPLYYSPYSELIDTTKMFECIAMQKPVIVSRLAGVEETFDDTCVSFFKPGDVADLASRIAHLHDHPNIGRTLAERALRRYLCLHWGQTRRKYVCRVEMLVKMSGPAPDNYLRAEAEAKARGFQVSVTDQKLLRRERGVAVELQRESLGGEPQRLIVAAEVFQASGSPQGDAASSGGVSRGRRVSRSPKR